MIDGLTFRNQSNLPKLRQIKFNHQKFLIGFIFSILPNSIKTAVYNKKNKILTKYFLTLGYVFEAYDKDSK